MVRRLGEREEPTLRERVASARVYGGTLALRLGRLADGRELLEQGLARSHGVGIGVTAGLVAGLFEQTKVEQEWRRVVPEWVAAFARHGRLGELGVSLVRAIPKLLECSASQAHAWRELWETTCEAKEEMKISLRLLRAAIASAVDGDAAALEALPVEERSVLTDLSIFQR